MEKYPSTLGKAHLWLAQVDSKTGASAGSVKKKRRFLLPAAGFSGSFFFLRPGSSRDRQRLVQGDKRTSCSGEQTDETSGY